jgi:hypothetical protein
VVQSTSWGTCCRQITSLLQLQWYVRGARGVYHKVASQGLNDLLCPMAQLLNAAPMLLAATAVMAATLVVQATGLSPGKRTCKHSCKAGHLPAHR